MPGLLYLKKDLQILLPESYYFEVVFFFLILSLCCSFSDIPGTHKLRFVPTLVTHSSPLGTTLRMSGNLSSDRVDSAAYRTAVNLSAAGNVSFEIRSAQGDESLANHSIFGIVLWQGDATSTTDYTIVSTPGELSCCLQRCMNALKNHHVGIRRKSPWGSSDI